jgi:hypothetical protein
MIPSHSTRLAGPGCAPEPPYLDRLMEYPMDHFVKLEQLPDDFVIPPKFQDRLEFDAQGHKLIFQGYMSKSEFDYLGSLSKDWRFRRTLEELFRHCVPDTVGNSAGLRRVIGNFGQLFARR